MVTNPLLVDGQAVRARNAAAQVVLVIAGVLQNTKSANAVCVLLDLRRPRWRPAHACDLELEVRVGGAHLEVVFLLDLGMKVTRADLVHAFGKAGAHAGTQA